MSDEASNTTADGTLTSAPATETATTEVVNNETPTSVEQLPEFAQKIITDLRAEAAKYRTTKVDDVAQAAKAEVTTAYEAKLAESNAAAEKVRAELAESSLNLAKLNAAIGANVPVDKLAVFADLLKGSTPEELKAHAETVKSTFGGFVESSVVDPSQGLNNGGQDSNDPFGSYLTNLWQNNQS